MNTHPHILLLGLNFYGVDRGIRLGIAEYANSRGPWFLHDIPAGREAALEDFLKPDVRGILGHFTTPELEARILATGLPAVNLSAELEAPRTPGVQADNLAVGENAARFFLDRGFHHFAWGQIAGMRFERLRREGFEAALAREGVQALILNEWEHDAETIRGMLRQAPKPLALFCSCDQLARRMADYAREANVAVPELLSLLGVDNFDLVCEASHPRLSSIRIPAETLGQEAARLLDLQLRGLPPETSPLLPPGGVAERLSTDRSAIADELVAKAVHIIREQSHMQLDVNAVVRQTHTNRRTLERRFRQVLGTSILHRIQDTKLDRAAELLRTTDLSIPEVAHHAGFNDPTAFSDLFRRRRGAPPSVHRARCRI